MSNESNLIVGILGAAPIAKKNVAALRSASSGCNFVAIASRSLEKAQAFVHDYVCNEGEENMIKIFGGDSAYAELIQSDCVSAVYVPLPVSVKKEWIIKALRNKKHVLCEKPVSINNGDYEDLLRIAKEENCFLMDGTMFVHNPRTHQIMDFISEGGLGQVSRINSEFCFTGDDEFFSNNIRTKDGGDPHGCVGDLGWYNVRLAQLVAKANHSARATKVQTTYWNLNSNNVPIDAQGLVFFANDDTNETDMILSFHCSFLHVLQQRVSIVGSKKTLDMNDFVIPREDANVYSLHGQTLTVNEVFSTMSNEYVEVQCNPVQEVLMWRNFSRICAEIEKSNDWTNIEAVTLSEISLENQRIIDGLMESIAQDGKPISL